MQILLVLCCRQDDVLGSGGILKERGELKERCEVLKRHNSDAKKELVELRENIDTLNSL